MSAWDYDASSPQNVNEFGLPKTVYFDAESNDAAEQMNAYNLVLSVFEGDQLMCEVDLRSFGKAQITFGSAADNDVVVSSSAGIVSRYHGVFLVRGNECTISDSGSTNGILFNGIKRPFGKITPNDVISIGRPGMQTYSGITFVLRKGDVQWKTYSLDGVVRVSIGRGSNNDITLNSPAVSTRHAELLCDGRGGWSVVDCGSFNGTFVHGAPVVGRVPLSSGDSIALANATMIFLGSSLLYTAQSQGVDVVARGLVQVRKRRGERRVTNDHISLHVKRGELVAIVGGSGSGKTTLLNALNGSDPAVSGSVEVEGVNLYSNYGVLKNAIGYVPQQDIVYDNLTLLDMLTYSAELRMPPDTTKQERLERAHQVIAMLGLAAEANSIIGQLSGGQKKRASIAVEMLADPPLFFLDEPTSGLDPGTEKKLMETLSDLARRGRTIILVTHTTLNLHLCDQVVFLGPGGVLCYAGSPAGALKFFNVNDFVDVYEMIARDPHGWEALFARGKHAAVSQNTPLSAQDPIKHKNPSFFAQLSTLARRYARLVINDTQRLVLLVAQAPLLAALICMVAGDDCFSVYEGTKSCLFALSCAAFWVGILNSIQEICKERAILKREYAGGLNLAAYILSKLVVLGALCSLQSLLLVGVFCVFEGVPNEALWNAPLELLITVTLTSLSAMCLGLLVSALFKNADRAIAVAPLLIMPQILFSGLIFELEGVSKGISAFVNCRWGMEAFGSTANLNALDLSIYSNELIDASVCEHEWEAAYDFTMEHLAFSWEMLAVFCVISLVVCGVALRLGIRK